MASVQIFRNSRAVMGEGREWCKYNKEKGGGGYLIVIKDTRSNKINDDPFFTVKDFNYGQLFVKI